MTPNQEKYVATYAQAFVESYPELPAERTQFLIEKAIAAVVKSIRGVNLDAPAFKLTAKKLGIKNTFKAVEAFLEVA